MKRNSMLLLGLALVATLHAVDPTPRQKFDAATKDTKNDITRLQGLRKSPKVDKDAPAGTQLTDEQKWFSGADKATKTLAAHRLIDRIAGLYDSATIRGCIYEKPVGSFLEWSLKREAKQHMASQLAGKSIGVDEVLNVNFEYTSKKAPTVQQLEKYEESGIKANMFQRKQEKGTGTSADNKAQYFDMDYTWASNEPETNEGGLVDGKRVVKPKAIAPICTPYAVPTEAPDASKSQYDSTKLDIEAAAGGHDGKVDPEHPKPGNGDPKEVFRWELEQELHNIFIDSKSAVKAWIEKHEAAEKAKYPAVDKDGNDYLEKTVNGVKEQGDKIVCGGPGDSNASARRFKYRKTLQEGTGVNGVKAEYEYTLDEKHAWGLAATEMEKRLDERIRQLALTNVPEKSDQVIVFTMPKEQADDILVLKALSTAFKKDSIPRRTQNFPVVVVTGNSELTAERAAYEFVTKDTDAEMFVKNDADQKELTPNSASAIALEKVRIIDFRDKRGLEAYDMKTPVYKLKEEDPKRKRDMLKKQKDGASYEEQKKLGTEPQWLDKMQPGEFTNFVHQFDDSMIETLREAIFAAMHMDTTLRFSGSGSMVAVQEMLKTPEIRHAIEQLGKSTTQGKVALEFNGTPFEAISQNVEQFKPFWEYIHGIDAFEPQNVTQRKLNEYTLFKANFLKDVATADGSGYIQKERKLVRATTIADPVDDKAIERLIPFMTKKVALRFLQLMQKETAKYFPLPGADEEPTDEEPNLTSEINDLYEEINTRAEGVSKKDIDRIKVQFVKAQEFLAGMSYEQLFNIVHSTLAELHLEDEIHNTIRHQFEKERKRQREEDGKQKNARGERYERKFVELKEGVDHPRGAFKRGMNCDAAIDEEDTAHEKAVAEICNRRDRNGLRRDLNGLINYENKAIRFGDNKAVEAAVLKLYHSGLHWKIKGDELLAALADLCEDEANRPKEGKMKDSTKFATQIVDSQIVDSQIVDDTTKYLASVMRQSGKFQYAPGLNTIYNKLTTETKDLTAKRYVPETEARHREHSAVARDYLLGLDNSLVNPRSSAADFHEEIFAIRKVRNFFENELVQGENWGASSNGNSIFSVQMPEGAINWYEGTFESPVVRKKKTKDGEEDLPAFNDKDEPIYTNWVKAKNPEADKATVESKYIGRMGELAFMTPKRVYNTIANDGNAQTTAYVAMDNSSTHDKHDADYYSMTLEDPTSLAGSVYKTLVENKRDFEDTYGKDVVSVGGPNYEDDKIFKVMTNREELELGPMSFVWPGPEQAKSEEMKLWHKNISRSPMITYPDGITKTFTYVNKNRDQFENMWRPTFERAMMRCQDPADMAVWNSKQGLPSADKRVVWSTSKSQERLQREIDPVTGERRNSYFFKRRERGYGYEQGQSEDDQSEHREWGMSKQALNRPLGGHVYILRDANEVAKKMNYGLVLPNLYATAAILTGSGHWQWHTDGKNQRVRVIGMELRDVSKEESAPGYIGDTRAAKLRWQGTSGKTTKMTKAAYDIVESGRAFVYGLMSKALGPVHHHEHKPEAKEAEPKEADAKKDEGEQKTKEPAHGGHCCGGHDKRIENVLQVKDVGHAVDAMWSLVYPSLFKDIHAPQDPTEEPITPPVDPAKGGLSTAAIIGIVAGSIVGAAILGYAVYSMTAAPAVSSAPVASVV